MCAVLRALEFPRREASDVEVVLVQAGNRSVARELNCDLDLLSRDGPTADGTDGINPVTAPEPIGFSRRHLPEKDRFTRVFSNDRFTRHVGPTWFG